MLRKGHILAISVIVVSFATFLSIDAQQNYEIPSWVKGIAGFWAEDKISDSDFGEGLSFLINNNIIKVPEIESLKQQITQLELENTQLKSQLGSPVSPPSTTFTSGTETYTNNLYGFTFNYPKKWYFEENPETTTYGQAGIVSVGPYTDASYQPTIIFHFFNPGANEMNLVKTNNEQGLLDFYSDIGYQPDASQVKFLDKSIEKISDGYKIYLKTTDVTYFPSDYIDGEWYDEEFISLINEYVILLYSDEEEFEIFYTAETHEFEDYVDDFKKILASFKRI